MDITEVVNVTEVDDEVSLLDEDLLAELAWQHLGVHPRVEVVLPLLLRGLLLGLLRRLTGED